MFLSKLNEAFASKSFISDGLNQVGIGLAFLVNIIHWALLLSKIKPSDSNILLHYNVISGADFVDKSTYAYSIPAIALALLAINVILVSYFYKREKLASYFMSFALIPIQLIFLVASIVIIVINE